MLYVNTLVVFIKLKNIFYILIILTSDKLTSPFKNSLLLTLLLGLVDVFLTAPKVAFNSSIIKNS